MINSLNMEANDIWCAKVMDWEELFATEGFKTLDMIQTIKKDDERVFETTRCPIRDRRNKILL